MARPEITGRKMGMTSAAATPARARDPPDPFDDAYPVPVAVARIATPLSARDVAEGFYRFKDLRELKVVSSRSDLLDKQRNLNFPLQLKPSAQVALFSKHEVHCWLLALADERDAKAQLLTDTTEPVARRVGRPPLKPAAKRDAKARAQLTDAK